MEGAAVRELEEETGFKADSIQEVSDLIVSDPGLCTLRPFSWIGVYLVAIPRHDNRQHETRHRQRDNGRQIKPAQAKA